MRINNSVIDLLVMKRNQVEVIILIKEEIIIEEEIIMMILISNPVTGSVQNVKIITMRVKISVIAQVATSENQEDLKVPEVVEIHRLGQEGQIENLLKDEGIVIHLEDRQVVKVHRVLGIAEEEIITEVGISSIQEDNSYLLDVLLPEA
jgi:hypothetical protein